MSRRPTEFLSRLHPGFFVMSLNRCATSLAGFVSTFLFSRFFYFESRQCSHRPNQIPIPHQRCRGFFGASYWQSAAMPERVCQIPFRLFLRLLTTQDILFFRGPAFFFRQVSYRTPAVPPPPLFCGSYPGRMHRALFIFWFRGGWAGRRPHFRQRKILPSSTASLIEQTRNSTP